MAEGKFGGEINQSPENITPEVVASPEQEIKPESRPEAHDTEVTNPPEPSQVSVSVEVAPAEPVQPEVEKTTQFFGSLHPGESTLDIQDQMSANMKKTALESGPDE